jgi:hypothetical protein
MCEALGSLPSTAKTPTNLTSASLSLRGCTSILSWEDQRIASLWALLIGAAIAMVQSCLKYRKLVCGFQHYTQAKLTGICKLSQVAKILTHFFNLSLKTAW